MPYLLLTLIALLFAPLLAQYLAVLSGSYAVGLGARIVVHILIPVVFTRYVARVGLWEAFIDPIKTDRNELFGWSLKAGLLTGLAAAIIIMGAFVLLGSLLDVASITANLLNDFNVHRAVFPLIGLAIVVVNPFLEEYFWRGFIFRNLDQAFKNSPLHNVPLYLTGFFFALHHVIIFQGWFNWWQFILTTAFLALAGVLFNWMFRRSGSIIASWLTHAIADLTIVAIGLYVFEYI